MDETKELYLRLVTEDDMELLFQWANDTQVRKNAFSMERIMYEEHIKWFANLMQDTNQVLYIYMMNDVPIGQIRFSIEGSSATIDYSIMPEKRGLGYGKDLLKKGTQEFWKSFPYVKCLVGRVKKGNISSEKCFLENGFNEQFKQFELRK